MGPKWAPRLCNFWGSGNPWLLHRTAVTLLVDEGHVVSCGMQAFSLPDARVALDDETSADEAQRILSALNVYQVAEDPLLLSGQTFSPDADTPRRALQRWPDDGYPPEHWCHNPYGLWRLGRAGSRGAPPSELRYEFIPALIAVLTALERKAGPLNRKQVEAARDAAACITMSHRDSQKLERSRGYADLDPELAWEQWQVIVANRG